MRDEILQEIRKLAAAHGGKAPGARAFTRDTGIRLTDWFGVYWARWSDALREAGLEPNENIRRIAGELYLTKLAEACRHFGRFPTSGELRIYKRRDPAIPSTNAFIRHFGSLVVAPERLAAWTGKQPQWADVTAILVDHLRRQGERRPWGSVRYGWVYLIRSGRHFKIGRSGNLERRVRDIGSMVPDPSSLVHAIRTDDPPGIEAYWHNRFADRRGKGEWFKLSRSDVAVFRKRRVQ